MIISDSDKSPRAVAIRFWWRVTTVWRRGPRFWISATVCAFAGCKWNTCMVETRKMRDVAMLSEYMTVSAMRTCSRCWRNVVTYAYVNQEEERRANPDL